MKYTIKNYEEFAIDYLDGIMREEEIIEFEKFLSLHPKIQEEIQNLDGIALPIFEVNFPDKKKLLQEENQRKTIPLFSLIKNIAAVVLLLLMVSFFWTNRKSNEGVIVNTQQNENTDNNKLSETKDNAQLAVVEIESEEKNAEAISPAVNKVRKKVATKGQIVELAEIAISPVNEVIAEDEKEEIGSDELMPEVAMVQPQREIISLPKIQTASFHLIDDGQNVPALPENIVLISNEINEKDGPTKIGKLLAKINLIPDGLLDEFSVHNLRDNLLPEYYSDIKSER